MTLCDLEDMHVCTVAGGPQGQQSTVVVMAPTIAVTGNMGVVPISTTCTNCQRQIVTNVSYEIGGLAWLIFAVLCFIGSVIQRYHILYNKLLQY